MTEQHPPDEEPIIELTEVVEPSAVGDDDIIELTEVVKSPPPVEEEIIELTEVAESSSPADEEIIELTDIVKSPPAEEEILELVDVVEEAPSANAPLAVDEETPDIGIPLETEVDQVPAPADDMLEVNADAPDSAAFDLFAEGPDESEAAGLDGDLDFAPMDLDIEENKGEDLFDSLGMKLEPELQDAAESDDLDFNLSTQELSDAIDLLDAKLAEEPPPDKPSPDAKAAALPTTISEAQLENALENVIRKMFAEKIDLLLNEAIEKSVTAEIENLKNQLLKDSPEDG